MMNDRKTFHNRIVSDCAPGSSAYSGVERSGACSLSAVSGKPRVRPDLPFKASLTLEAAMALPLFLFFLLAVMSFLMMLRVQMHLQDSMEDLSRRMGKSAYLIERGDEILSGGELDSDSLTLARAGLNGTSIMLLLSADTDLGTVLDSSRVIGGRSGLYTYASGYDPGTGILDMVVAYDYNIPWLPGFFGTVRMVQRARSHVWVGEPLRKNSGDEASGHQTVYVTETGTVYHTSPDCHYLDLSIREVDYDQVSGLRNQSGARYQRCEECARSGVYGSVFITDYGTCWHSSLSCSGLKRTVREVELDEIGHMRECAKCAQHGHH